VTLRETIEKLESETLAPQAARSAETRGRDRAEPDCPVRPSYQRDRDRILHSKAFRRLMHKTQVFLSPIGDHYRTRLTHTLEVAQIARTIARSLRLNEILAEAIALGHDLGHSPFGHAGEDVLNRFLPSGFNHYLQSLRVVEKVENEGQGLNLTVEVRDGILKHSKGQHGDIFRKSRGGRALTLEGDVVRAADIIAYVSHDIDDAFRAGMLRIDDAPEDVRGFLRSRHSERLNLLVVDVITESQRSGLTAIGMTEPVLDLCLKLRAFLFETVYRHEKTVRQFARVEKLLTELWTHVSERPAEYVTLREDEPADRQVTDFIAGMTDRYAIQLYESVFVPRPWAL